MFDFFVLTVLDFAGANIAGNSTDYVNTILEKIKAGLPLGLEPDKMWNEAKPPSRRRAQSLKIVPEWGGQV
jgi:hypothetical protein